MTTPGTDSAQRLNETVDQLWMLICINPELFTFTETQEPNPILALMNWRVNRNTDNTKEIERSIQLIIQGLGQKNPQDDTKIKTKFGTPTIQVPTFDILDHVHHLGLNMIEEAIYAQTSTSTIEQRIISRRTQQMNSFKRQIGADIAKLDKDQQNLFNALNEKTYSELIQILVSLENNDRDVTLIYDAALRRHDQLVEDLLKAGAKVDKTPENEQSALMLAAHRNLSIPIIKSCMAYRGATTDIKPEGLSLPALLALRDKFPHDQILSLTQAANDKCLKDIKVHLPTLWKNLIKNPYYVTKTSTLFEPLSKKSAVCASTFLGAMTGVAVDLVLYNTLSSDALPNFIQLSLLAAALTITIGAAVYIYARKAPATTLTMSFSYDVKSPTQDREINAKTSILHMTHVINN